MKVCEKCLRVVSSNAKEGHEPKRCGLCAREGAVCPWCGAKARQVMCKTTEGQEQIVEREYDLGWHCQVCDDYYAIDDEGKIY